MDATARRALHPTGSAGVRREVRPRERPVIPSAQAVATAERHVEEADARVVRQAELFKRHPTPEAERTLRGFELTARVAREHLRVERKLSAGKSEKPAAPDGG
jgi:hypothetical protein